MNLVGNAVKKLLPTAFPMGSLDRSRQHCVDVEGWHVNVYLNGVVRLTCENVTNETLALQGSPICEMNSTWPFCVPLAIGDRGVGGLSALQACCRFGGGNRQGLLTMSEFSPMYCTPSESNDMHMLSSAVVPNLIDRMLICRRASAGIAVKSVTTGHLITTFRTVLSTTKWEFA